MAPPSKGGQHGTPHGESMARRGRGTARRNTLRRKHSAAETKPSRARRFGTRPRPRPPAEHHDPAAATRRKPFALIPPVQGDWYTLGEFAAPDFVQHDSPFAGHGRLLYRFAHGADVLPWSRSSRPAFIFYAIGYMHDELHEVTDHEVTLSDGHHPATGRGGSYRFFQYLSLFLLQHVGGWSSPATLRWCSCFWGAGWHLLVFPDRLLYRAAQCIDRRQQGVHRQTAWGDFGMIIGLMALFASLGTFAFGDTDFNGKRRHRCERARNLQARSGRKSEDFHLAAPDGMLRSRGRRRDRQRAWSRAPNNSMSGARISARTATAAAPIGCWSWRDWEFFFCGCVGKSAQFPAARLAARRDGRSDAGQRACAFRPQWFAAGPCTWWAGFFPVFAPEVLLVIGHRGPASRCSIAATIAITATDIKARAGPIRTVSQFGLHDAGPGRGRLGGRACST